MNFVNKVKSKLIIFVKAVISKTKALIQKIKSSSIFKKITGSIGVLIQKIKSTSAFKKISTIIDNLIIKIKPILHKLYIVLIPKSIREDNTSKSKIIMLLLFSIYFLVVQFLLVYGAIFITVKTGGKSFTLPNVEGVEMFTAFNILQKEGMTLQVQSHIFPNSELGTVVVQEPKAGTKVKRGRSVSLVVNMSPSSTVFMPDFTGKNYNEAMEIITNDIISVIPTIKILNHVSTYKKGVDDNTIMSQIPLVGEPVTLNSEILFTVNEVETADTVELKNLVGEDALTAIKYLEEINVLVDVQSMDVSDTNMYGKVLEQSINEGDYSIKELNGMTLTVANDLDNDTKIRTFRYNISNDRVGESLMEVTLDDGNGRTILFTDTVSATRNIRLNYSLKGTGVITIFFDETPFETININ